MNLTTTDIRRIRELRYQDGLSIEATAAIIGCSAGCVWNYAPGRPGKVPVTPLREMFEQSGLTASEVARRMGWDSGHGADCSRVRRALGLMDDITRGKPSRRRVTDAETAGLLAEAMGRAAWEAEAA